MSRRGTSITPSDGDGSEGDGAGQQGRAREGSSAANAGRSVGPLLEAKVLKRGDTVRLQYRRDNYVAEITANGGLLLREVRGASGSKESAAPGKELVGSTFDTPEAFTTALAKSHQTRYRGRRGKVHIDAWSAFTAERLGQTLEQLAGQLERRENKTPNRSENGAPGTAAALAGGGESPSTRSRRGGRRGGSAAHTGMPEEALAAGRASDSETEEAERLAALEAERIGRELDELEMAGTLRRTTRQLSSGGTPATSGAAASAGHNNAPAVSKGDTANVPAEANEPPEEGSTTPVSHRRPSRSSADPVGEDMGSWRSSTTRPSSRDNDNHGATSKSRTRSASGEPPRAASMVSAWASDEQRQLARALLAERSAEPSRLSTALRGKSPAEIERLLAPALFAARELSTAMGETDDMLSAFSSGYLTALLESAHSFAPSAAVVAMRAGAEEGAADTTGERHDDAVVTGTHNDGRGAAADRSRQHEGATTAGGGPNGRTGEAGELKEELKAATNDMAKSGKLQHMEVDELKAKLDAEMKTRREVDAERRSLLLQVGDLQRALSREIKRRRATESELEAARLGQAHLHNRLERARLRISQFKGALTADVILKEDTGTPVDQGNAAAAKAPAAKSEGNGRHADAAANQHDACLPRETDLLRGRLVALERELHEWSDMLAAERRVRTVLCDSKNRLESDLHDLRTVTERRKERERQNAVAGPRSARKRQLPREEAMATAPSQHRRELAAPLPATQLPQLTPQAAPFLTGMPEQAVWPDFRMAVGGPIMYMGMPSNMLPGMYQSPAMYPGAFQPGYDYMPMQGQSMMPFEGAPPPQYEFSMPAGAEASAGPHAVDAPRENLSGPPVYPEHPRGATSHGSVHSESSQSGHGKAPPEAPMAT
ncbi:hypothetical protein CDCA_CDCA09G2724 [Cyanidium caldarium]|uniref:Uncharacterized protein n=1 Tax=Cyanidium caldarium TaxID=2771 RepID=A0AAV9IWQ1_CYACA|nr:hypothetical protein CDCA_CDCA09G2724 [Cyanidium caldarium]